MAKSTQFDDIADTLGAAAGRLSVKARRVARAATSDGAGAARKIRRAAERNIYHELAEAKEQLASAETNAMAFGKAIAQRSREQPVLALAAVAALAAVGASLLGMALRRR